MTVADYKYYHDYLINLDVFYNQNLILLSITDRCKLWDEIKRIKELLKIK